MRLVLDGDKYIKLEAGSKMVFEALGFVGSKKTTLKFDSITMQDIPNEDMVDIFFSIQNGHELFITEQEAIEDIDNRGINVEEYTPVYEKAEEVVASQEVNNSNSAEVFADDSKSIAMVEDETNDIQTEDSTNVNRVPMTDGNEETLQHIHKMNYKVTTIATCTTSGIGTYNCDCGYTYTEEIVAIGHSEILGGTENCHSKCNVCGEILKDETYHSYTSEVTLEASCTTDGVRTYSCECGHSYTEGITATGHAEIAGGAEKCHSKCGVCGETLEDGTKHSYTSEVTKAATCTEKGEKTYTCACSYSYTDDIDELGHTEVAGGEASIHSKCSVCGETLKDGTAHSYTRRK